jgi:excisionase family DNA binding protein
MSTDNQKRTLLSTVQAAAYCNVHPNTIRNLITRGKLPAIRIGARIVRIDQADLDALFTSYRGGEYGVWSR